MTSLATPWPCRELTGAHDGLEGSAFYRFFFVFVRHPNDSYLNGPCGPTIQKCRRHGSVSFYLFYLDRLLLPQHLSGFPEAALTELSEPGCTFSPCSSTEAMPLGFGDSGFRRRDAKVW